MKIGKWLMKKQYSQFKIARYSAIIMAFAWVVEAVGSPEEKMAEDLMYLSLKEPVPEMDHINLDEVIHVLRRVSNGDISKLGRTIVSPRRAQIALLRIGDDQEIAKVIEAFRKYDTRYALAGIPKAMEYAHQPKLIPHLAEDFFRDEDPKEFVKSREGQGPMDPTIVASPLSIYAGVIAMRIVSKEPSFTDETRQWAETMLRLRIDDAGAFQKTMRGWWMANAEFFESEEYEKVSSNSSVDANDQPVAQASIPKVEESTAKSPPKEETEPQVVPEITNIVPEPGVSKVHLVFAGIAGVGILILFIRTFLRGRAS